MGVNMLVRTIDGKKIIEINWVESNLKMAAQAETDGDSKKAWFYFLRASYHPKEN